MGGSCFEQVGDHPAGTDPEHAELDNFWPICDMPTSTKKGRPGDGSFELTGELWPTTEHYFQASKFPEDPVYQEQIRKSLTCMGPEGCFMLGRNGRMSMSVQDWDSKKIMVMYNANYAKFEQNSNLRDLLCGIRGRIRAQGNADEWATWNEILLERIREELRDKTIRDEACLNLRISLMDAFIAAAASGDERMRQAVTKSAQRREAPSAKQVMQLYTLSGYNPEEHDWLGGGRFRVDPLNPEVNGQPHLMNIEGTAHIFLGTKRGTFKWIIDEEVSAAEVGGSLTLDISAASPHVLPIGSKIWDAPYAVTKQVNLSLVELQ